MAFVWDPKKEADNIRKRHLPFDIAEYVFDDPKRMVRYDGYHSATEERYQTIGMAGKLLFVVYSYKDNYDTNVISVRLAEPRERRIYYGEDDAAYAYGWERVAT